MATQTQTSARLNCTENLGSRAAVAAQVPRLTPSELGVVREAMSWVLQCDDGDTWGPAMWRRGHWRHCRLRMGAQSRQKSWLTRGGSRAGSWPFPSEWPCRGEAMSLALQLP